MFLNAVAEMLGDYAVNAAMETFTASKYERHPTDLAMLRGARLVTASETEEGRTWAEQRIKQMTGGDTVTARFMRQDYFTYQPQFKLTLVGNHAPKIRNVDEAMRRRFRIAPFTIKPQKPDLQLPEKLKTEYPAILAWAIQGSLDWQRHRLILPSVIKEANEAYFNEQDAVSLFIDEMCEVGANLTVSSSLLFARWRQWAEANGEYAGNIRSFKSSLEQRGFMAGRSSKTRIIRGLQLNPEHTFDPLDPLR